MTPEQVTAAQDLLYKLQNIEGALEEIHPARVEKAELTGDLYVNGAPVLTMHRLDILGLRPGDIANHLRFEIVRLLYERVAEIKQQLRELGVEIE